VQLGRSGRLNSRLDGRRLRSASLMSRATERRLVELAEVASLTARGSTRLLRVARTIADLADSASVEATHLEEAARFRPAPLPLARAESA